MRQIAAEEWTPQLRDLWDRVSRHDFEAAGPFDFTRRLARDKGWTLSFSRSAVTEYRRFCFIAVTGSSPATPSEEVDEVWHQHLTYSRDYWNILCKAVLCAPLHHDPTTGGSAEQDRFREQYASTLARYESFFGPPPELYWPATHVRFGRLPRFRTLDSRRQIALPRPLALWRRLGSIDTVA
jgi:hypothetical protein